MKPSSMCNIQKQRNHLPKSPKKSVGGYAMQDFFGLLLFEEAIILLGSKEMGDFEVRPYWLNMGWGKTKKKKKKHVHMGMGESPLHSLFERVNLRHLHHF